MSEIRNLLPNPWPNGTSKWRQFNGTAQDCEMRMSKDESSMYFRGLTNTKCSWSCKVLDTPTGQMVFGLTTGTAGGMKARVKNLFSVELTEQKLLAQSNSFYLLPFELKTPGCDLIIDGPAKNVAATLNHLLLMTQEDWTHMRNLKSGAGSTANIRWFAPPKTAATGVMSTPALDRGGCAPSTARHYPHIDVEVAA